MRRADTKDEIRHSIMLVEKAIAAMRAGKMVVLTDDEDRENEGDLILASQKVTPEAINFMATHGRGLICLTLTEERARKLQLSPMVQENSSPFGTAFTVSIEAARGVTTGISAYDRATTIRAAIAPRAKPSDLVRPGHVFPLVAKEGGVLVRTGQTEGSVDLARLAGLAPSGILCEVMSADGTMARRPELQRFARRHQLVLLSVADLIRYRLESEPLVHRMEEAKVPVAGLGQFTALRYRSAVDQREHIAYVRGDISDNRPVLVRMHCACPLGDSLMYGGCDCGLQLRRSLQLIASEERGVLVYLQKGEPQKLGCVHLNVEKQQSSDDQTRLRELGVGAQILRDLGVKKIRLLTNNPKKIVGMQGYGLSVVARVPVVESTPENRAYLRRKLAQGHLVGQPVRARRRRRG